ncbi:hypothetical protein [Desulfosarcina ovata]|nr:hypothetical protein [Desulfosarcina ovata]
MGEFKIKPECGVDFEIVKSGDMVTAVRHNPSSGRAGIDTA